MSDQVVVNRQDLQDALTLISLHVPPDMRPSIILERLSAAAPPSGRLHMRLDDSIWSLCGHGGGETTATLTDDPREVNCRKCLQSREPAMVRERAWRQTEKRQD